MICYKSRKKKGYGSENVFAAVNDLKDIKKEVCRLKILGKNILCKGLYDKTWKPK